MHSKLLSALAIAAIVTSCATAKRERVVNFKPPDIPGRVGEPHYGPIPPEFDLPPRSDLIDDEALSTAPAAKKKVTVSLKQIRKKIAGPMVSINLKDATVGKAIDLLRKVSGVNIITSGPARDKASTPLVLEDMSWIEALKIIVRANGLVATSRGADIFGDDGTPSSFGMDNVIIVTTYEDYIARQEMRKKAASNAIELARRRRQEAEEILYAMAVTAGSDRITHSYKFKYADPHEVVEYLTKLFVDAEARRFDHIESLREEGRVDENFNESSKSPFEAADISFAVFSAENLVAITAPESKIPQIMARIKEVDVQPRQIYIEARIVEIQRNHVKDLGIQWGGHAVRTTGFNFPNTAGVYGAGASSTGGANSVSLPPSYATDPVTGALLQDASGAALGVSLGNAAGSAVISARLFALERAGVSRTLSNPKVMAINGERAVIKSGKEIPYQAASANTGVNIRFKEAVISLSVTPQIMQDDMIRLKIEAKKDEVDRELSVQGTPAIKKKELLTSVTVDNGGSAVLGGLFEGEDGGFQNRVPWFHKIPALGWLFKSDQKVDNELELLVFITPSIVEKARSR